MPTKKFLKIIGLIALGGWVLGVLLLGPPGLSKDYRAAHKAEHELYLSIVKSELYKRFEERPELYQPGSENVPPEFANRIAFVERYTSTPEFQAEQNRIFWFELYFDTFNAALVVVLFLFFGKKPLMNFLGGEVEKLRERMRVAEAARNTARERRERAEANVAALPEEQREIEETAAQRIALDKEQMEAASTRTLEALQQELEDRLRQEEAVAEARARAELVTAAMEKTKRNFQEKMTPEEDRTLIVQFIQALPKQQQGQQGL